MRHTDTEAIRSNCIYIERDREADKTGNRTRVQIDYCLVLLGGGDARIRRSSVLAVTVVVVVEHHDRRQQEPPENSPVFYNDDHRHILLTASYSTPSLQSPIVPLKINWVLIRDYIKYSERKEVHDGAETLSLSASSFDHFENSAAEPAPSGGTFCLPKRRLLDKSLVL